MITVPAPWLRLASGTHRPRWRVLLTAPGGQPVEADITGGSISKTGSSWPRCRVRVTVPAPGRPVPAPAHLLPFGTRLEAQFRILDDPQAAGWVTVASCAVVRSVIARPQGVWDVEAVDASGLISEDAITAARPAPALGSTVGSAISALIRRTLPAASVTITGAAGSTGLPADWETDADPWRAVEQLAGLAGATVDVAAAPFASFTVRALPDIGTPVDTLAVAENLTAYGLGHERTWNACAMVYRDPADRDKVTRTGWWTAPGVTAPAATGTHVTLVREATGTPTQAQADAAAATLGKKQTGRCRTVRLEAVPRPWLEPGDTVTCRWASGVAEPHLIESLQVPFDGGPISLDARNAAFSPTVPVEEE